jgi:hypothetical protein
MSYDNLKTHIELQLMEGEDYDDVHFDHIFPLSRFGEYEVQKACHWSNIQPLPARDNMDKRAHLPTKAMAAKVERWAWPEGITEDDLPEKYDGWATALRM